MYPFPIYIQTTMPIAIPADLAALTTVVTATEAAVEALSITQRYSSQTAFMYLLEQIGCDPKESFRLLHDGFDSIESLVSLYETDIEDFRKQLHSDNKTWMSSSQTHLQSFFSPVIINKLLGIVYYFKTAVTLFHTIPDSKKITDALTISYGRSYAQSLRKKPTTDDDTTLPELTDSKNWTKYKDAFKMYLSTTYGARDIPISYVINDTQRVYTRSNAVKGEIENIDLDNDTIYDIYTTHFSPHFKQDNATVYNKLKESLLNKSSYNHISSFDKSKNGRAAWLSLRVYFEGEHYIKNLRETAFLKLQTTFYRGQTRTFTFEKYINIHKAAHRMLEDAGYNGGQGLDNETKVQFFKNGIKAEGGLETALSMSRANRAYTNFDALVSFLTAEVDHIRMRKSQLKSTTDRTVSGTGRGGRGNSGRG